MEEGMFCFQCQEAGRGTGCTVRGVCGKNAELSGQMDELIAELKRLALIHERRGGGIITPELSALLIRSLFLTVTNTNFDPPRILLQIRELRTFSDSLDPDFPCPPAGVLAEKEEDIRSLKELLLYGMKGIAAYAEHAGNLGFRDDSIPEFLLKALAASAKEPSPSAEELLGLVLECGGTAVRAMELLDRANTSTYGNPEITKVKTSAGSRPGILVSGHDLKDLQQLLEQSMGKGIDIYTHGEMLPANSYPGLKKYPHLHGNYGGAWYLQNQDFQKFNGPVLMTTNCIIPLRSGNTYLSRLFTTGSAGYPGAIHIPEGTGEDGCKDFSALIRMAEKSLPPEPIDDLPLTGGFAHAQVLALAGKIVDAVRSGKIRRFIVMAGCDGRQSSREYFTRVAETLPPDSVILTAGCAKYRYIKADLGEIDGIPRVLDAGQCNDSYSLALIALKLKEVFGLDDVNRLPLSFDIAWYEQKAVAVLLALLFLGFRNIRLGPTLPAFLSPGVLSVLVKQFGIRQTADPVTDVEEMMQGR